MTEHHFHEYIHNHFFRGKCTTTCGLEYINIGDLGRIWLLAFGPTRPARDENELFGCLGCTRVSVRTELKAIPGQAHELLPNQQFLHSQAEREHRGSLLHASGSAGDKRDVS